MCFIPDIPCLILWWCDTRFPGLTRGLVAVLLYHDGRRCLLASLRSLIQAREGVAWTLGLFLNFYFVTKIVTIIIFDDINNFFYSLVYRKYDCCIKIRVLHF